jgi:hypothetical protein
MSRLSYLLATTPQLLQRLAAHPIDCYDVSRITLVGAGLQIELPNGFIEIEPVVGYMTCISLVLSSTESGGPLPQAQVYALRPVYANVAAVPTTCGLVCYRRDWRVCLDRWLATFAVALRTLTLDVHALTQAYSHPVPATLMNSMFYKFYGQTRYIHRSIRHAAQHADRALGVAPGTRRRLRIRQRQEAWQQCPSAPLLPSQATDLAACHVFNSLTASAHQNSALPCQAALEQLAERLSQLGLRKCHDSFQEQR